MHEKPKEKNFKQTHTSFAAPDTTLARVGTHTPTAQHPARKFMDHPKNMSVPAHAFVKGPLSLQIRLKKTIRSACSFRSPATPRMVVDPASVGTGYAFLDGLKGVVIGPTINEITAAIAGGTVGVMGTIIALEVRRQRVKERKQCPYCRGTGKLPCATCCTVGAVPSGSVLAAQEPCGACHERGFLQCNHVRESPVFLVFRPHPTQFF